MSTGEAGDAVVSIICANCAAVTGKLKHVGLILGATFGLRSSSFLRK